MVGILVVLGATVAWLHMLVLLYRRGTAHLAPGATDIAPPAGNAPAGDIVSPEDGFPSWLGVSPTRYEQYVDRGLEDLDVFLADHPTA